MPKHTDKVKQNAIQFVQITFKTIAKFGQNDICVHIRIR